MGNRYIGGSDRQGQLRAIDGLGGSVQLECSSSAARVQLECSGFLTSGVMEVRGERGRGRAGLGWVGWRGGAGVSAGDGIGVGRLGYYSRAWRGGRSRFDEGALPSSPTRRL